VKSRVESKGLLKLPLIVQASFLNFSGRLQKYFIMKTFQKIAIPVSLGILGLFILNSCSVGIPKGATAVQNFNADKYLEHGMK
jgi:hypothetical protein